MVISCLSPLGGVPTHAHGRADKRVTLPPCSFLPGFVHMEKIHLFMPPTQPDRPEPCSVSFPTFWEGRDRRGGGYTCNSPAATTYRKGAEHCPVVLELPSPSAYHSYHWGAFLVGIIYQITTCGRPHTDPKIHFYGDFT